MAMSAGPAEDDAPMSDINTTPLVDVMLVLLIIFLITVPVVIQTVPVNLPKVVFEPTTTKPENVALSVRAGPGGACEVYWGQTKVGAQELLDRAVVKLKREIDRQGGPTAPGLELPEAHISSENTMSGGESLWRANWSERADPFANIARGSGRGPGWQRAATSGGFVRDARPVVEVRASAVSLGNPGRSDISPGQRVFHSKFGYGQVAEIEGNKLEIDFEHAGRKRVLDSFVSLA